MMSCWLIIHKKSHKAAEDCTHTILHFAMTYFAEYFFTGGGKTRHVLAVTWITANFVIIFFFTSHQKEVSVIREKYAGPMFYEQSNMK